MVLLAGRVVRRLRARENRSLQRQAAGLRADRTRHRRLRAVHMIATFIPAALLAILLLALFVAVWGLFGWSLARMAAMSDRRVDRMRDAFSPRAKGTSDASPPCAPLVPARVREVVTGDERPLLKLIDSERNRP